MTKKEKQILRDYDNAVKDLVNACERLMKGPIDQNARMYFENAIYHVKKYYTK